MTQSSHHGVLTINADATTRDAAINSPATLSQHLADSIACLGSTGIVALTEVSGPARVLSGVVGRLESTYSFNYVGYHQRLSYAADCNVVLFDVDSYEPVLPVSGKPYTSKEGKYLSVPLRHKRTHQLLMVHSVHFPYRKGVQSDEATTARRLLNQHIEHVQTVLDIDGHVICGDFNLTYSEIVQYLDAPQWYEAVFDHDEKNNIVYDTASMQLVGDDAECDEDDHLFSHQPVCAEFACRWE